MTQFGIGGDPMGSYAIPVGGMGYNSQSPRPKASEIFGQASPDYEERKGGEQMPGEFGKQNNSGFQYQDEAGYEEEIQQKLRDE